MPLGVCAPADSLAPNRRRVAQHLLGTVRRGRSTTDEGAARAQIPRLERITAQRPFPARPADHVADEEDVHARHPACSVIFLSAKPPTRVSEYSVSRRAGHGDNDPSDEQLRPPTSHSRLDSVPTKLGPLGPADDGRPRCIVSLAPLPRHACGARGRSPRSEYTLRGPLASTATA